ncbi:MAG: hypothetical protein JRF33_13065 [Deltaproteobacteria bacterium]|nr:hypothetical protein [Deltaproteobacteria bacterium]
MKTQLCLLTLMFSLPATATPPSRPDPWRSWPAWSLVAPVDLDSCRLVNPEVEVFCDSDNHCEISQTFEVGQAGCPGGLVFFPRDITPNTDNHEIVIRLAPDGIELKPISCSKNSKLPQGAVCFPSPPGSAKVSTSFRAWISAWNGDGPFVIQGLSAKHLLLGKIGASGFGGLNLRIPQAGSQPAAIPLIKARGSFRYDYRLTVWNEPALPGRNETPVAAENDPGFQPNPGLQAAFAEVHGNPVSWKPPGGYRHAGVFFKKSSFGFAGLTTEFGASHVGTTWAGLGRIGADFWLKRYLYGSLVVEGSTIGDLAFCGEVAAATPNFVFIVPSLGVGLGVGGDFLPERTAFVRTRVNIQWPVFGISIGFDWRITPSFSRRFHITLVFGI